ncbi:MAG: cohesin domain-containing protein [bacterium]
MRKSKSYLRFLAAAVLALALAGMVQAKDKDKKAAEKFYKEGQRAEIAQNWDQALAQYEQALAANPSELSYQIAVRRMRFQAAQAHVHNGQKLRKENRLIEALAEFEKAYAMDPSSAIAEQELKRTLEMMERENQKDAKPEERGLTATELARKQELERIARLEAPPELKPLSRQPINLRMTNQPPRVLYETVGKLAGINVVFDPDYRQDPNANRPLSLELTNSTLENALDYLATMTRTFWQPMSENTIFVAADTQPKRREYEDTAVKVFYLQNATTPQELTEIATTLRTVASITKLFQVNSLNAIIVRGTTDQLALVEKLVYDLDKPRSEVVVDVVVMEANRAKTRDIAATVATAGQAGIASAIVFTPQGEVTTDDKGTPTQQLMSLSRIAKLSTNDFSVTVPGALLKFMMTDRSTRVLQSPQVRAANGEKATLRIGDKVPVAQGGYQPIAGTVGGYGSLYSTFQFIDVGVNVDITPIIHGDDEVTLKVAFEISNVRDRVDIGGISQPVIGQRRIEHTIRIKEGEASLLGGLMQDQDTKSVSGVPGLASIPVIKRLFSSESIEKGQTELLIALIPHIVRSNGITDLNLRPVATGADQVVRVNRAPRIEPAAPSAPEQAAPGVVPGAPPATVPGVPGPAAPAPRPAETAPETAPPQAPPPAVQRTPSGVPVAPPAELQLAPGVTIPGVRRPSATPGGPQPAAPQAGMAATRFTLRPSATTVQRNATVTLSLYAENARELASAPFTLQFDPKLLRLEDVQAGPLLASGGQQVVFTRNIQNDVGVLTVNLGRMPDAGGVTGSGVLAVFTFRAVAAGEANITMPRFDPQTAQRTAVAADAPHAVITVK